MYGKGACDVQVTVTYNFPLIIILQERHELLSTSIQFEFRVLIFCKWFIPSAQIRPPSCKKDTCECDNKINKTVVTGWNKKRRRGEERRGEERRGEGSTAGSISSACDPGSCVGGPTIARNLAKNCSSLLRYHQREAMMSWTLINLPGWWTRRRIGDLALYIRSNWI